MTTHVHPMPTVCTPDADRCPPMSTVEKPGCPGDAQVAAHGDVKAAAEGAARHFFHGIHRVDLDWGLSLDAAGIKNPFAVKAFLEAEKGIQSTSSRAASWAPASEDKSAPAKVG